MPDHDAIAATAARHDLSRSAVQALADGLARGGPGAAQWNHPDLGGMGQWLHGGLLQIGDMFNDTLKARVRAALDDLVREGVPTAAGRSAADDHPGSPAWWPADLGEPASAGAQNDMRYACFPESRRLVVQQDGQTIVYDTGAYQLTGFAQAQGAGRSLTFSGPDGRLTLADLKSVD